MIGAPLIEEATTADIEALGRLRHQMNWSRSEELLGAILRWRGGRIFVIRAGELSAATGEAAARPAAAIVVTAAPPIGVIGSVMVRPEFQRAGLGRAIMEHSLTWLTREGVRRVYLDATPAGRPLYRRLGFVDIASSWYTRSWQTAINMDALRSLARSGKIARVTAVTAVGAEGLPRIAALDQLAYGGDRLDLLDQLARLAGNDLLIAESADGAALGYLMTRPPESPVKGMRVGPLVASDDATAAALLAAALEREGPPESRILSATIAGDNPRALALFDTIGAAPIEDDLIMRLDFPGAPGDGATPVESELDGAQRPRVYCWLAPMVF
ncbi:MAG TPA: GNAT family N-acetyltransferase [Ktedonobacterales bacterium]|nr:GNAT family N-acetyltransferase [Ktedonobacterales bacterium]